MNTTLEAPELGSDISECDREPIHIPGSIQPHGLLLLASGGDLRIVGGAGDLEEHFGTRWQEETLASLLGKSIVETLLKCDRATCSLGRIADTRWEAAGRRAGDLWLIELEESEQQTATDVLTWIDDAGLSFERAGGLLELCERAAESFRSLTGFDRVMIYRFLDDDSGVVVAEDLAEGLHSFRNHHFPASDIPPQARALYLRNRVRVIPDVAYQPQPIRPAAQSGVDLSDVELRSVSPIHIQYLKNMGVAASASISIVKDGVLWGLVACHNLTPRHLSAATRRAASLIAAGLARQINAKEQAEEYRERLRVRADEDAIAARVSTEVDPEELFKTASGDLRRMFEADAFAVLHGGALHQDGICPDPDDIREVAAWVRTQGPAPFHSNMLGQDFAPAAEYRERASGLLAITLSSMVPTVLLWFRAEERELVEWAGNPHKAVTLQPGEKLTPRASFEAWTEEVRGRARPWSHAETEAARRLLARLYEARQNRRVRDLAEDLNVAVADKDRLIAQQGTLLKEVNHRVQNSLQLVMAFLSLQARSSDDPAVSGNLSEAQRRLSAVALVHRRLYADDNVQAVDLSRYLADLVADLKTSMGTEWADLLTLDLAPIVITADDAVQVGLIVVELVINAQKYAYAGSPGPIFIGLERHRARFRLVVADKGRGKTGTRKGFGTRMLDAMVKRLNGNLEDGDNGPGVRSVLTAPITMPRSTADELNRQSTGI
ncbi:histidine kinase dimerization/phosphoacceptor domain -containing protein [Sphingomonas sp. BAUL-RG-20F-R05-02]|uniref:histidine kinase dimerization/phosphoacceptor domain -containing protein n=1 Tax=Sphingomonas sp. BAUL-RG-20F-R05-02 TaxID=2914830 RepID=UPI001F574B31|nr:histidine kinase dimerization/phosphoacceptor domain -containing protein [Sphingomonas sp. BAUL-RG-20F-R05-02]